ncbi:MAG: hypothetical protein CMH22_06425 [Methylophaga sp.]|nr:hypothetical protein [Methylophaga sp.]|tara:strand:- start:1349 stop:2461 length:1113 start_codon:yes stop_codon:yes gene_type:complete
MAIVFTTALPQDQVLNAYNNSVIRFGTDSGAPARSVVQVDKYKFEITPNNGEFYFNLKDVVTLLINQNKFIDAIAPDSPANYVFPDNTLFLDVEVSITIFKTNGASETDTLNLNYLKAVQQLFRPIYDESETFRILLPADNIKKHVTYFEGYPFDVSIYSNASRSVTVTNKRTAQSINISLLKGVNRLFLSNGENDNLGFEGSLPLNLGVNELVFSFGSESYTLFVDKKPVACGVYVKWFNQSGGWSYWLFEALYQEKLTFKATQLINNDFRNLENTSSRQIITAKESQKAFDVETYLINHQERLILGDLPESPKVYFYAIPELQPFKAVDFKEVTVKDGTIQLNNTKNAIQRYAFTIELPNQYTQKYAG